MFTIETVHSALCKTPPDSPFLQPLSLALYTLCKGEELRPALAAQVRMSFAVVDAQEGTGDEKQA